MKTLGYIWTIVRHLITIFVVIAMFGAVEGKFETIVLSFLTVLYVESVGSRSAAGNLVLASTQRLASQLATLSRHLNDPNSLAAENEIKELEESFQGEVVADRIAAIVNLLIWIIAIWNLLNALAR